MKTAAPGVLRRPRNEVPATLSHPITVLRRIRDTGTFIVDAVLGWHEEVRELKRRANENKR